MGVLIYVQASLTGMCEAWIPKNDCRHFMHSIFFAKCFNVNLQNIKKGILQALWRNMCIHKHSEKCMQDHNQNLQKSDLRKYIALSLTFTNLQFIKSLWEQFPEEGFVGKVCLQLCCLHLSYCYCLLCFIAVNANKLLQKLKCRQQSSVLSICCLHTQGSLLN